ncbi:hypothetical protein H0H87_000692 [Tephrocybe sp. NHM501043]|nr:hypothetical protein H0H87_000692 [Tephrocybe sp. NHM501043]
MIQRTKASDDFGKEILTYLWDNYVQYVDFFHEQFFIGPHLGRLSGARHVFLMGHGPGSRPIMDLLERRTASVMKVVKGVVQIVGHSTIPTTPKYVEDLAAWYQKNSFVVLPSTHRVLTPTLKPKDLRRHGNLVPMNESQVVKLIHKALPPISEFIKQQLGTQLITS